MGQGSRVLLERRDKIHECGRLCPRRTQSRARRTMRTTGGVGSRQRCALRPTVPQMLSDPRVQIDVPQCALLRQAVIQQSACLISADLPAAAHLVLFHFTDQLDAIVAGLADRPRLQYDFLTAIFTATGQPSGGVNRPDLSALLQEQYLTLMCQFEPHRVYGYLRSADTYRLEQVRRIGMRRTIVCADARLVMRGAMGVGFASAWRLFASIALSTHSHGSSSKPATCPARSPSCWICCAATLPICSGNSVLRAESTRRSPTRPSSMATWAHRSNDRMPVRSPVWTALTTRRVPYAAQVLARRSLPAPPAPRSLARLLCAAARCRVLCHAAHGTCERAARRWLRSVRPCWPC